MPQVTVYIRAMDVGLWKKLDKKSEFIHNALNGAVPQLVRGPQILTGEAVYTSSPDPAEDGGSIPPSSYKKLLNIPGVEIAKDAKCKGQHFRMRMDCGKLNCPWGKDA